jgi:3-dehydroquinate dehydratase type I
MRVMDRPKICVVITAKNSDCAVKAIENVIPHDPDFIEIRFDYMDNIRKVNKIREVTNLPLIATNRVKEQGGLWARSEMKRIELLISACEEGFEYVDIEISTESIKSTGEKIKDLGAKLIVSYHDFTITPRIDELYRIMHKELDAGADICKIIGMAKGIGDGLTYLNFIQENSDVNLVCFGMGREGIISRIFSPLFGSSYTYASIEAGKENAPGQISISNLKSIYRILGVL